MEKKLRKLFDYQRFEGNERLEKVISKTESLCATELSDDDLFLVNAAGESVTGATYSPTVPDIDDNPDFEDIYPENPQSRPFN